MPFYTLRFLTTRQISYSFLFLSLMFRNIPALALDVPVGCWMLRWMYLDMNLISLGKECFIDGLAIFKEISPITICLAAVV